MKRIIALVAFPWRKIWELVKIVVEFLVSNFEKK